MPEANHFMIFLQRLSCSGIKYMVTGSVAAIIYAEPRMTYDIDIVLELAVKDVPELLALFGSEEFYCPSKEIICAEIAKKSDGHFNIIHHESGFKADIYPAGTDELHKWAMARRHKVKIAQSDIYLAPAEYIIIRKLQYYSQGGSEKHIRDIKRMLELSSDLINVSILKERIAEYDLADCWNKVIQK